MQALFGEICIQGMSKVSQETIQDPGPWSHGQEFEHSSQNCDCRDRRLDHRDQISDQRDQNFDHGNQNVDHGVKNTLDAVTKLLITVIICTRCIELINPDGHFCWPW